MSLRHAMIGLSAFLICIPQISAAQNMKIQVLSATVKNKVVSGAQVILQKEGQSSLSGTTNAQGSVSIPNAFKADDPSVSLIIKKDGFSPLVAKCPCDGLAYAISETMRQLDGLRVVISWAGSPQDLDLHTVYPSNHVFFSSKVGTDANLDVDDTDGYGPETITITKKHQGEKYVFAVHNYSDKERSSSNSLSSISAAKVFVYIGQSLIRTYYVPPSKPGTLWIIFGIDGLGSFHDINSFSSASDPDDAGRILKSIIDKPDFGPPTVASPEALALAKQLNKKGEDAYHAGQLDNSIDLYKQAIDADFNFGQAWSNLGLSYQKASRSAEAIWASRKAIELANGATANTVKASSYYNIAKMYGSQGQWADAKQNFEAALQNKELQAYKDGIARMQSKLQ